MFLKCLRQTTVIRVCTSVGFRVLFDASNLLIFVSFLSIDLPLSLVDCIITCVSVILECHQPCPLHSSASCRVLYTRVPLAVSILLECHQPCPLYSSDTSSVRYTRVLQACPLYSSATIRVRCTLVPPAVSVILECHQPCPLQLSATSRVFSILQTT